MTQKELEQKVIDAEGRVAKREAVLKKHNSQLAKMVEKGADRFDISIKREDIKSATSKLAEAREILKNWQDKLNTRITRDAYLEANTPEILKDFLENWKQHAIGYYREKRIRFIEYRKDLKAKERAARLEALQTLPSLEKYRELYKGRELTDYDLANLWPRRDVDAFLSERGLEYHQIQKKLREAGDQITLRLLEIHNEDEREAWLEKTTEEVALRFQNLFYLCHYTDGVQVFFFRMLDPAVFLCYQKDFLVALHRFIECKDGFLACHIKVEHHFWKHDQTTDRDRWQTQGLHFGHLNLFLGHSYHLSSSEERLSPKRAFLFLSICKS